MPDEARTDPITRLDPQIVEALQKSQELAQAIGPMPEDIVEVRAYQAQAAKWWNEGGPDLAEERDAAIPGPIRDIPVRVYRNADGDNLPVFVYFHGGGFRIGSQNSNIRQMKELAAAWPGVVISSDYAHMPEHVFPDALNEASAVYAWLADNGAEWGIDGSRIAFGGASAGANLAVGAAVHTAATRPGMFKAGLTIVGALDDVTDCESMHTYGDGRFFIVGDTVPSMYKNYAPDAYESRDPRVMVTEADMGLLPEMLVCAAECDPLADSSRRFAAKLDDAGKLHALNVYPGMMHLYFGFTRTVDQARQCVGDIAAFLTKTMG
jgi:acetyl esterase